MKNVSILLFVLFLQTGVFAQALMPVHFQWGTVHFPENAGDFIRQPAVSPDEVVHERYVRYLQFYRIPHSAQRRNLERAGMQFMGYVSQNVYLVSIPVDFDLSLLNNLELRSAAAVNPEWKLAKTLREKPYGEWAMVGGKVKVNVQLYPHVGVTSGAQLLEEAGFDVWQMGNQNGFLTILTPESELPALAAKPYIRHLELAPPPGKPEDINGRSIHRANALDSDSPMGKHYTGEGVNVLVRDDGPIGPHIDFAGRVFDYSQVEIGNHGDGVAGIFAGAGNLDPVNRGMAAGANVFVVNYESEFQDNTLDLYLLENVRITNTSYSNGCNAGYTLAAQTVDRQLYDYPTLMHVFSAGNSNNSICGYGAGDQWGNVTGGHKMAKNAIATANLNALSQLDTTSSRGPAHDGRLKPDIAAHGQGQVSTDLNNEYRAFGGTSGAAPGIAGCLTQLTQAYESLNGGQEPEAALLKAALLNTANDLGNAGPDYKFGWGHVNAARALEILENNTWLKGSVDQGGSSTHSIVVPGSTQRVRVMLLWPDPPAAVETAKALVNDLDLTLAEPGGTILMPWLLDPTPDPLILNTPAGNGRDSLNNMEQVALEQPAPGVYNITVNGFEVPEGPQPYFLVWYFENDQVKLTYPSGGESLAPGEVVRIHWDAEGTANNFTLRYSTDGAQTFLPITTLAGDKRSFDWTAPNTVSGQVHLLLLRGNRRDTTDFPCTIAPLPTNLKVEKVCPDSMTVSYSAPVDTLRYEVYLLGEKYMELAGRSHAGDSVVTIPLKNPHLEQWVSVAAVNAYGLRGRRAFAINTPGGLVNCPQNDDIRLDRIMEPAAEGVVACSALQLPVAVWVRNDGTQNISGANIYLSINNDTPVAEALPDIAPGDSILKTFSTIINATMSDTFGIDIWSSYSAEDYPFNDTLRLRLPVVIETVTDLFTENFEGPTFPSTGWLIANPDQDITWGRSPAFVQMIGINGQGTQAAGLNCRYYLSRGAEDYLYLPPVDLTDKTSAGLRFDLAHAARGARVESLRLELFPGCDLNATPIVLWEKNDPDLSTALSTGGNFVPDASNEWRVELVALDDYLDQSFILRFAAVNDNGNNIWLDNINLTTETAVAPVAAINTPGDTVCRNEKVTFSAIDQGPITTYTWFFGSFSTPSTASGPGPHEVVYSTPGLRSVRLSVQNPAGADTAFAGVLVRNAAAANFTVQTAGLTITCTNSSSNADSYLWDFGDGNTSTDVSPVHTYAATGIYPVKLTAFSNQCPSAENTQNASVSVGVADLNKTVKVQILPNPSAGAFDVLLKGETDNSVELQLFDGQGRLIRKVSAIVKSGVETRTPFREVDLPKGAYLLKAASEQGVALLRVVVL